MTFRPKLLLMPMSQFVVLLQLVSVLMFVFCVTRTHTNNEFKYDGSCTAGTNCYLRDDHSH